MQRFRQPYACFDLRGLLKVATACCLILAVSCRKDPYPNTSVNDELVILAELTAGQPLKIPVSKSIQVGDGGIITFEKVKSAIVTLTRQDGKSWTLALNNSPDYASDPASVYTSLQRPRYGTKYSLKVQDPLSGTVTATTVIPARVNILRFDTSSGLRSGIPVLNCRFTLTNPPDSSCLYIFEALKQLIRLRRTFYWGGKLYDLSKPDGNTLYNQIKDQPGVKLLRDTIFTNQYERMALYTSDNNVDNAQVSGLDSSFRRIFLPGKVFNGRPYATAVSIDRRYFVADNENDLGRVVFQIKSVTAEFYNYLFWYEKYKTDVGSVPAGQLYSPPGNIQNGLGIFGGSSKYERALYFDVLR